MRATFAFRRGLATLVRKNIRPMAVHAFQPIRAASVTDSRACSMQQRCNSISMLRRSFSSDATIKPTKPKVVQDLPTQKFWEQIFDILDLDQIAGDDGESLKEQITITKWYKTPRSAVKAGEKVFEVEAASIMMDFCADHAGFLGAHLVEEGEILTRGKIAAQILDVPETVADLSDEVMQDELTKAEGSVKTFEESIERFTKERRLLKEDLSLACRLAGNREVEFSPLCFASRLPGNQNVVVVPPPNVDYKVVGSSNLDEFELGREGASPSEVEKAPAPLSADRNLVVKVLREHRSINTVLLARPFHATTVPQLDSSIKAAVTQSVESRVNATIAVSPLPLLADDDEWQMSSRAVPSVSDEMYALHWARSRRGN
ncbi:hypothetical protein GUITHDRAFT_122273 [Guillardia theta CCMP2712]|uniref:Lipoyl-binding domain-containing protein n=1 Tax=Guillardia theta (strain CCMP2712) TaxID=905079 RepID=L1I5J2_GUITC|nr:hypothetical protein GUITHDRAFT_122273 [Guillardia theta CCMP2712]EKX31533.1 hypothetical protein GUITHDRAFT_122273 [Guillardia theta CCMP2712]|eukprot:XP_005818513.1 hypothetical protein GUITHDRAFT_122273 [Guillardia theta CCMP2712]